ncbi:HK97-fold major capsid protein [Paenibacillus chitinolyticus]|uniref:HK97-fold major capsid protein n=1 Tax=Paenibacillus chitinolyticus TaxID=79263 RepID=UPI003D03BD44
MKLNFMELAEAFVKGEILPTDKRLLEAEKLLKEMASTEDGRQEIAEVIAIYIDQNFNKFDIAPYIFQYKNFKLGDKPEFRLKKKGIKAYWIAPNSSTPKSRNYQETLSMEFDSVSVRPECLLDELKAGRVTSLADLLADAKEAVQNAVVGKVFTILAQVYNATNNAELYQLDTTNLSQSSVNKAIDTVVYRTGGRATIIGDMMLVNQIRDFSGFTDTTKDEIMKTGRIGVYRGANIISVSEVKDPATNKILVPKNRLYVVSQKLGYAGTYGDSKFGQETSIEDWTWNARIDKEWGAAVTEPEGMFVVEVQ